MASLADPLDLPSGVRLPKQIADHQAVQFRLADMGVKVEAAHQLMVKAARMKDAGERNDLEAGMAKYLASEYCRDVVEDSIRIHGGYEPGCGGFAAGASN